MRILSIFAATIVLGTLPCLSQMNPDLQTYFRDYIGLTEDQISSITGGQAVAKILPSRTPAEIFVFGAIHVDSTPESYLELSRDFERLRTVTGFLALGQFSNPPQLSDLIGFGFDSDEVKMLKSCLPGNCQLQMPASYIEDLQRTVDWSAPDAEERVNQILQTTALNLLIAYQREGDKVLGTYNDKRNPSDVARQFEYMLSYSKALPRYLPDFYNYLLAYPKGKPENVEDSFYWAKVKFGLKPTLRVVHVLTRKSERAGEPVYAIAEKQLYSSHYFHTALDLTFCIRDRDEPKPPGFYLVKVMGSEQAGLTGLKGGVVRKVAVDRSASSLQKSLAAIKNVLEHAQPGDEGPVHLGSFIPWAATEESSLKSPLTGE
ncbi:MAG TPA: hypothetical protein VMT20_08955 [Terriglobia bacterium]|nr:hypothetical protein [Terriglobia bacterium]